jgi:hypothetical protein
VYRWYRCCFNQLLGWHRSIDLVLQQIWRTFRTFKDQNSEGRKRMETARPWIHLFQGNSCSARSKTHPRYWDEPLHEIHELSFLPCSCFIWLGRYTVSSSRGVTYFQIRQSRWRICCGSAADSSRTREDWRSLCCRTITWHSSQIVNLDVWSGQLGHLGERRGEGASWA